MAKDRSYKYGWHPDRPQDASRAALPGDDVSTSDAPDDDGWVTSKGFEAATMVTAASTTRAARLGAIRGEKRGSRWYIAPDEVERWSAITAAKVEEFAQYGERIACFEFSCHQVARNIGTLENLRFVDAGYRASALPIQDFFDSNSTRPPEQRTRYTQFKNGLKFTSSALLSDDELELRYRVRRAILDRERTNPASDRGSSEV